MLGQERQQAAGWKGLLTVPSLTHPLPLLAEEGLVVPVEQAEGLQNLSAVLQQKSFEEVGGWVGRASDSR